MLTHNFIARKGRLESSPGQAGFSRADLLVTAGVVFVLALLPLAGATSSRNQSRAGSCAENLRQLTRSWQLYAADYRGFFPPSSLGLISPVHPHWISGSLDFSPAAGNTNILNLTDRRYAAMGPYVTSASLFRCPEDESMVRIANVVYPRVRSYSMNSFLGAGAFSFSGESRGVILMNQEQVRQPDRTFVLADEHPGSINDGALWIEMAAGDATRIIDYPGSYHFGGATLSFADGHTELWRWLDPRTRPLPRPGGILALNVPSPNNQDMARLQSVTTYFR